MKISEILKEYTDTDNRFSTVINPDNTNKPNKSYGVKVSGTPPNTFSAGDLWTALEDILPKDYPKADFQQQESQHTPQRNVMLQIRKQGVAIVKTGIVSYDVAESIADKFNRYKGKWSPEKPIPAEVVET